MRKKKEDMNIIPNRVYRMRNNIQARIWTRWLHVANGYEEQNKTPLGWNAHNGKCKNRQPEYDIVELVYDPYSKLE